VTHNRQAGKKKKEMRTCKRMKVGTNFLSERERKKKKKKCATEKEKKKKVK
jgi:hypothetical protein